MIAPSGMQKIITALRKEGRTELRVGLVKWCGQDRVAIGLWQMDPDGEMRPGKQGFVLEPKLLPELIGMLERTLEDAHRRGLL